MQRFIQQGRKRPQKVGNVYTFFVQNQIGGIYSFSLNDIYKVFWQTKRNLSTAIYIKHVLFHSITQKFILHYNENAPLSGHP